MPLQPCCTISAGTVSDSRGHLFVLFWQLPEHKLSFVGQDGIWKLPKPSRIALEMATTDPECSSDPRLPLGQPRQAVRGRRRHRRPHMAERASHREVLGARARAQGVPAIALHGSGSIVDYFELEEAVIVQSIGQDYHGPVSGVSQTAYDAIANEFPQTELYTGTNDTFVWLARTKPATTWGKSFFPLPVPLVTRCGSDRAGG